jgi:Fe-S-cluster containining protein
MTSDATLFDCTQCGDCCKGFGGTYLADDDMITIANHLSISVEAFKTCYCEPSGKRFVLAQRSDGYCIFFNQNCSIHEIKPKMCRQWPFIENLIRDIGNWRIMSSVCPGIQVDADEDRLREFVYVSLGKSICSTNPE